VGEVFFFEFLPVGVAFFGSAVGVFVDEVLEVVDGAAVGHEVDGISEVV